MANGEMPRRSCDEKVLDVMNVLFVLATHRSPFSFVGPAVAHQKALSLGTTPFFHFSIHSLRQRVIATAFLALPHVKAINNGPVYGVCLVYGMERHKNILSIRHCLSLGA